MAIMITIYLTAFFALSELTLYEKYVVGKVNCVGS